MQTRLSVNINKIALIRNSRGSNLPDLVKIAADCERFGADGITVHPRPDERHVKFSDLPMLREIVRTEFNIEGYPSEHFVRKVIDARPDQVTLVPDPPAALTSDSGWKPGDNSEMLKPVIDQFKRHGIRVSLFLDPVADYVYEASRLQVDRIELYTGNYAKNFHTNPQMAVSEHILASKVAQECGLGLNAGHDLNLENLQNYKDKVINLMEVSIGHALVCDALSYGLQNTIGMYKNCLR